MSSQPRLGGASTRLAASHGTQYTPRDPYPLPAQSLRSDSLADVGRNRAAGMFGTIFLSLVFLVPMICIGLIRHFQ